MSGTVNKIADENGLCVLIKAIADGVTFEVLQS
jgi:hypothetical protein